MNKTKPSPAITITDLKKIYRPGAKDSVRALDGITLNLAAGKIHGLLGPNGAGKTTLVKILSTMTPPTEGAANVLGFDVVKNPLQVRRRMAVVLQQSAVETLLTVEDNLLIYGYMHGLGRAEAKKRIKDLVDEFDLGSKLRSTVMELSIGTKRRIQVAKVFLLDSPLVILDEATTGMDPLMKRRVLNRLRAESAKGRTILLTTQVLSEAEELCDNIVIIHNGKSLASGTLQDLRSLSKRLFRVSLAFGKTDGDLESRLRSLNPAELTFTQETRNAELLFRGEETSILAKLAELSQVVSITHFEVRGPDLEEIFMTIMKEAK